MSNIRKLKLELNSRLLAKEKNDSKSDLIEDLLLENNEIVIINALIALLPKAPIALEAGRLIGQLQARLAQHDLESAKNIMRRFIWQMNEESGNIAWGVPFAFAYSLVYCEQLACDFHKILLSYIRNPDTDSNFVDFAPLREQCYQAIEIFLLARPEYQSLAKNIILQAQKDNVTSLAKLIKNVYN